LVQGQTRQTVCENPISKRARAKWTRGVAQVVELLLCKFEALSSHLKQQQQQKKLGTVVHTCNPNTLEAEARRYELKASLDYISENVCRKKKDF
jgi:hypothetical protein